MKLGFFLPSQSADDADTFESSESKNVKIMCGRVWSQCMLGPLMHGRQSSQ